MKTALLLCMALTSAAAAQNLTVRLFSTSPVSSVTVLPSQRDRLLCNACPAGPFELRAARSVVLLSPARHLPGVTLRGGLQLRTPDGRTAQAAGLWRIHSASDGLHILLTLPSERYVAAVLAGESSPSSPLEALKALAVTVRSFALSNPHRHAAEGLCDSTHCQALSLVPVDSRIEQAVRATAGETLFVDTTRVPAYFSQNCGGLTEDAAALWGGPPQPWLVSHTDVWCQRNPSRWRAEIAIADLARVLRESGFHPPPHISTVSIQSADAAGRARSILINGDGSPLLVPAPALRLALGRALGWNLVRSDWYTLSITTRSVIFNGRGLGHGVGLCQAGAAEMAARHRTYREILRDYFPGTTVRIAASDTGWTSTQIQGISVQSVQRSPALFTALTAALATATQRLPAFSIAGTSIVIAPTTELFRQLTDEPGWLLAVTRGDSIVLQPPAILARNGPLEPLLLHELLHAALERQAANAAPLWLREGLPEFLASGPQPRSATLPDPAQVNAALYAPPTQQISQQAHREAAMLVQHLVQARGLPAVLHWLRTGLPPGFDPRQ